MMQQRTLIISIDLGTSSTTASHISVNDSFTPDGQLRRERGRVNIANIRDWPGANKGDATGNICVPTDLIYSKADKKLLFWGFQAQQYLDDPYPEIHPDTVFVVEHIKLLLQDPDNAPTSTVAGERYRGLRARLTETLGKQPHEVFEDFLNGVILHVIGSANRKYFSGISSHKIELILAFPSGWPDFIHTMVAGIGARAMVKAIVAYQLQDMVFGIENVYTVSETLCGVQEWLRDTIAEASESTDLDMQGTKNLDVLSEGDCFLPVDIGGGTGCMTPLRLVTKEPLQVDQLGPTQSLAVSGEAVQAEFEAWLRSHLTCANYPDGLQQLIYQICRKFKEEKKDCGLPPRPGSKTWNLPAPGLRPNRDKGFEKDHMKIDRRLLEKCFDPVIDLLEESIVQVLREVEGIKAIVFLGQFGSSSEYLRKRMAQSHINSLTRIRYSDSGKLNVVRGAISERLYPSNGFVRKSKTLKSYGSLVTLPYYPGSDAASLWPNAQQLGAVPYERDADGSRLKVIEWAIAKGTVLTNGQMCNIGKDGRRHHTWPYSENKLEFDDKIIVSDEVPPSPQLDGKSYTLWTEAHESNVLQLDGRKIQVQQLDFSWDLTMSQKIDETGTLLGAYEKKDLEVFMFPEVFRKGKRRRKLRKLDYDLVWDITEMQVKVHVRAVFPNPSGPLTTQLAKERPIQSNELLFTGESRSKGLERDIEISRRAKFTPALDHSDSHLLSVENSTPGNPTGFGAPNSAHLVDDQIRQEHQQQGPIERPPTSPSTSITLHLGRRNTNSTTHNSPNLFSRSLQLAQSDTFKMDGRRRAGCYSCKLRKQSCDGIYTFNKTSITASCKTCIGNKIECYITEPADWDDAQRKAKQSEWKCLLKPRKRKSRDESDSSHQVPRQHPATVNPAELSIYQDIGHSPVYPGVAPVAPMGLQQ